MDDHDDHSRVVRSANPILVKSYDDLNHFKNLAENIDTNDVEQSGRVGKLIHPSRTTKHDGLSFTQTLIDEGKLSGEGSGAPQARQLLEPHSDQTATTEATKVSATVFKQAPADRPRQSNPDIQDIITGIVKLLNGNVNVQANTAPSVGGRPLRPLSTRINNRGPPRITDVPALPPDFDVPSPPLPPPPPTNQKPPPVTIGPMRMPTPYPFDLPPPVNQNTSPARPINHNGPNGPNQNQNTKRPGLYRPVTIPPWSRPPYRRPFPPRRPTPIPPYQPKPEETISLTSERPGEDILTLDLGSEMISSFEEHKDSNVGITTPMPTASEPSEPNEPLEDNSEKEFEKNKEKSSSKMEKHSKTHSTDQTTTETITESESTLVEDKPSTTNEVEPSSVHTNEVYLTETSLNLSNSSTIEEISNKIENETILLPSLVESSIEDVSSKVSTTSEPTEALPTSYASIMSSTASPVTSTQSVAERLNMTSTSQPKTENSTGQVDNQQSFPYYPYRPRPGIVLDDTEYKPGGVNRPPILTARPPIGQIGEIFDVTVSAIQGPGGSGGHGGHGKPYVIPGILFILI